MAKVTPEEFQEKHARRLKASTDDMRRGVERVTVAPTQQAKAKKEKMRQGINAALDNGKWERGLDRVSLPDWQAAMINKGINRVAAGIDGAKQKVVDFASELLPFQDGLKKKIETMPDLTLEDNLNRMTAFVRGMAGFKRSK